MKIGIVGYQGSGKSTLFEWLTGVKPDPALAHASQSAMAPVPEPRVDSMLVAFRRREGFTFGSDWEWTARVVHGAIARYESGRSRPTR